MGSSTGGVGGIVNGDGAAPGAPGAPGAVAAPADGGVVGCLVVGGTATGCTGAGCPGTGCRTVCAFARDEIDETAVSDDAIAISASAGKPFPPRDERWCTG
jgi:hypothetical protein